MAGRPSHPPVGPPDRRPDRNRGPEVGARPRRGRARVDASVPGWDLASLLTRDLAWLQDAPKSPETARPAIDTGCDVQSTDKLDGGRKAGEGL